MGLADEKTITLISDALDTLTEAILHDFPAETKVELEWVRNAVKVKLDARLSDLLINFMVYDIIEILMAASKMKEEQTNAG